MAKPLWKRYAIRINRMTEGIKTIDAATIPTDDQAEFDIVKKALIAAQKKVQKLAEQFSAE